MYKQDLMNALIYVVCHQKIKDPIPWLAPADSYVPTE